MKNGATGHLDETYWKLKNDNGWLGGKGDDWEETPYWLGGALPLAYILNDEALKVNGSDAKLNAVNGIITVNRLWKSGDEVVLTLPMEITATNRGRNSRTIERGPLVYALKVESKWKRDSLRGEREFTEGPFYEPTPKSDWNYGLSKSVVDRPSQAAEVKIKAVNDDFVWNEANAPVEIILSAKRIPDWKPDANNVADRPVTTRADFYQGKVEKKKRKLHSFRTAAPS